jgi:serine/threonine protein kinase
MMRPKYLIKICILISFATPLYSIAITEVGNEENYNEKCDVYSFAVLFWEMLALKTPYNLITMNGLKSEVWNGEQKRPFINQAWPEPVKVLLKRSWNKIIIVRPSFKDITETIRKQCVEARGGHEEGLSHSKRRSTFVFPEMNLWRMNLVSEAFSLGK